jgi:hypothetical protein
MSTLDRLWQSHARRIRVRREAQGDFRSHVRHRSVSSSSCLLVYEEGLLPVGLLQIHGQGHLGWAKRLDKQLMGKAIEA